MIIGRRRSRVVGAIWGLVGLAFAAAAVVLWLDQGIVSFEVPAAVFALVLAWTWWRQHAVLDRHGISTIGAFRERRVLWASIDEVEVRRASWLRAAIALHPRREDEAPIPVPASAGLRPAQRDRLLEFLTDVANHHDIVLVTDAGEPFSAGRPSPMDDVRDRVMAEAVAVSSGAAPTDGGPADAIPDDEAPDTAAGTDAGPATDHAGAGGIGVDEAGGAARRPTPLASRSHEPGTSTTPPATPPTTPTVDPRMPAWLRPSDHAPADPAAPNGRPVAGAEPRRASRPEGVADGRGRPAPDPA